MKVSFRATGLLRELFPGKHEWVELDVEQPLPVRVMIEEHLGINPLLVVAVSVAGRDVGKDYVPNDGDEVTLIAPLAGG